MLRRRRFVAALALPVLPGACAAAFPPIAGSSTPTQAEALLAASAAAHGSARLTTMSDVSVAYAGEWHGFVNRVQPDLVDSGFRGGSEERLLLREALVAQAHTGPKGRKQVVRTPTTVRVWFNGAETDDSDKRDAAAMVADDYALFLLGPMLLAHRTAGRSLAMAGAERIEVGGRNHACDVLRVRLVPGQGFSGADELAVFIDRDERLMRRVRFTLNGLEGTRNAVAEVDTWDHVDRGGVRWPTRFHERLLRPFPVSVHDWRLTGLDLDRGLAAADFSGPAFGPAASVPARALA